ncbi:hypothetical protein OP862_04380 [Yersinia massiliensis]|nr:MULTISPECIES: hypothetical protein [Yersinia]MDA5549873.1 hypothetical protein [Yersinia massiliensis]MDN0128472.1 hypothetical protein [Yersinia massiliensis]UZM79925.1 hypothetical protein OP862_04380 [Yersinia massiliensis]
MQTNLQTLHAATTTFTQQQQLWAKPIADRVEQPPSIQQLLMQ